MIENSIKQFRARRASNSKRVDTGTATKQRLGLAQREIARTQDETSRALQRSADSFEAQYRPEENINKWASEIDSLRAERASREQSTTGALDMGPIAGNPSTSSSRPATRWEEGQARPGGAGGRAGAEEYLGNSMSDVEWDMLLRTTYAESSPNKPEEQAAIMSVILNRVNAGGYPDTVEGVIQQRNQFQAATGTRNDRGPSDMYKSFNNNGTDLAMFENDVTPLLANFTEYRWENFTSNNPAAYGAGTNLDFLRQVTESQGSMVIGGTVFGTVN